MGGQDTDDGTYAPLTQLQTSKQPSDQRYNNILDAFRKIYLREGIGGFYKGLLPSLLGVFHVVVQFPLYEYFKSLAGTSSLAHLQPLGSTPTIFRLR